MIKELSCLILTTCTASLLSAASITFEPGKTLYLGQQEVTAELSGLKNEKPAADCCDGEDKSEWSESGEPVYKWSGTQSGSDEKLKIDTSKTKSDASLEAEVTQKYECDASGATEEVKENGSKTFSVVEIKSLKFTDDSSPARTGVGSIKMVYVDGTREVKVSVQGAEKQVYGDYPKWTKVEDNSVDGEFEPTLTVGDADLQPTIEPAKGAKQVSGRIYVENENLQGYTLSSENGMIKSVEQTFNLFLSHAGYKGELVKFGGSAKIESKKVDFYNDGSKLGRYWAADGSLDASFRNKKSPELTVPMGLGVSVTAFCEIEALTVGFKGSGAFDESKKEPNLAKFELSAESSASATGRVSVGVPKVCSLDADIKYSFSISASAELTFPKDSTRASLKGKQSYGSTMLDVGVHLRAADGACEATLYRKSYSMGQLRDDSTFGPYDI
jgi:hypothetical protein